MEEYTKDIWLYSVSIPEFKKKNQQTRNRRNFLKLMKGIYEKTTVNIMLNSERLKAFSLR